MGAGLSEALQNVADRPQRSLRWSRNKSSLVSREPLAPHVNRRRRRADDARKIAETLVRLPTRQALDVFSLRRC